MLDVDAEKNQQVLLQVLYSITANYIYELHMNKLKLL